MAEVVGVFGHLPQRLDGHVAKQDLLVDHCVGLESRSTEHKRQYQQHRLPHAHVPLYKRYNPFSYHRVSQEVHNPRHTCKGIHFPRQAQHYEHIFEVVIGVEFPSHYVGYQQVSQHLYVFNSELLLTQIDVLSDPHNRRCIQLLVSPFVLDSLHQLPHCLQYLLQTLLALYFRKRQFGFSIRFASSCNEQCVDMIKAFDGVIDVGPHVGVSDQHESEEVYQVDIAFQLVKPLLLQQLFLAARHSYVHMDPFLIVEQEIPSQQFIQ